MYYISIKGSSWITWRIVRYGYSSLKTWNSHWSIWKDCISRKKPSPTPNHWLPAQCSDEITCAPRVGVQRHIMARHFSCLLKPWKITKPGRITSGSHLLTTRVNPSREIAWMEFKPTLFALYLEVLLFTWRNHRFQAARKSAECRFEIRDGPGNLRRPFKPHRV